MKKINVLILSLVVISLTAGAQSRWSIGVQSGCVQNVAKFNGGDEDAGALFTNQPFKTLHLGVNFRYRICDRFSFQSGFDFTEIGFSYTMAKNYSLLKPEKHYAELKTSTCISSIPTMLVFNTKLNCTSKRLVAGFGTTVRGIDSEWESEHEKPVPATEGRNAEETYLTEQSSSNGFLSASIIWMVGIEKVLAKGNMIRFAFEGQQGLSTIAHSTVSYTENDKNYSHNFINRGSSVAFSFTYYFNPIGTRKANRISK